MWCLSVGDVHLFRESQDKRSCAPRTAPLPLPFRAPPGDLPLVAAPQVSGGLLEGSEDGKKVRQVVLVRFESY